MATKLLTPGQAADELGTTRHAVYKAMDRGALRYQTVYGRRLIPPEALAEYRSRPTREYRDPRRRKPATDPDET